MKKDIILAGVGGQGILTIASVIGAAAIEEGLNLKQAEVHGMSQRGGDVQSHLRISDQPIYSDLIPMGRCDVILSVEPMEALRYVPYLSEEGWIITNKTPFKNINNYPEEAALYAEAEKVKNHLLIDADAIAKELGSPRSMNIVILGAASFVLGLNYEGLKTTIAKVFGRKGEAVVNANIAALDAGRKIAADKVK
ncbi:MAG: indolepyruvate oxidoreductase subunit beta [Candidatus Cloacimonetes bacterium]|nr:indolepyruvate oxidoreductase subunit beta [Candidatus Cloacimonadota bacterium]